MAVRYPIYELKINEKFARVPKVTWDETKKFVFDIFSEIAQKNLFKSGDKLKSGYNLYDEFTDDQSLCIGLETSSIVESKLMNSNENKILDDELDEEISKNNPFLFRFNMGLIDHTDLMFFEEGKETKIFSNDPNKNVGRFNKTAFGIIVSDKLKKILIIKKSDTGPSSSTIGLSALLDYLLHKSTAYARLNSTHTIKITPILKDSNFDPDDIASLFSLTVSINSDLVDEYRRKTGKNDLAYNLLIKNNKFLGGSRTLSFTISIKEEGDKEAIELFRDLYNSFIDIEGEEIEKMFNVFKIYYENNEGKEVPMNFKRSDMYRYEPMGDKSDFDHIFDAFVWVKSRIG